MVELEITREGIVAVFANCVDEKTDGNRDTDCGEDKETDGVFLDGLSRVGKDGMGMVGIVAAWGVGKKIQCNRVRYICFPLVELEAGPRKTRGQPWF